MAAWAILAPVFVPMFVLLGFTPEGTMAVYRIGESSTNIITPLTPYLPFVLATTHRYVPKAGIGTLISLMLPYAAAFLVSWTLLLLAYVSFGWPIGPGMGLRLPTGPQRRGAHAPPCEVRPNPPEVPCQRWRAPC